MLNGQNTKIFTSKVLKNKYLLKFKKLIGQPFLFPCTSQYQVQTAMKEADYISSRIDQQIKWYDDKSSWNQKRYKFLKTLIIFFSVSIPFLTGLIGEGHPDLNFWLKIAVGAFGIIIAASEGILSLQKYQDNWMEYRNASETLQREKLLFLTQSGPYREHPNLQHLVERIESFTANENKNWMQYIKNKKSKPQEKKS